MLFNVKVGLLGVRQMDGVVEGPADVRGLQAARGIEILIAREEMTGSNLHKGPSF